MDDSVITERNSTESLTSLGMSSFGQKERQQFGQNVRLAMGCIEGTSEPVNCKAMPSDASTIRQRLKALNQDITSHHADLLELLVRFDDLEGWKIGGAVHCAAWMNMEIGVSPQLGWEYLRAGRSLRSLPTTTALFRAGKLSWSKIRLITRVADKDNEKILCHAALDASVTEVGRICSGYRWKDDDKGNGENDQALKQWESRGLYWDETSNGSTCVKLILPPETAQAFLNSVEHSLNQLDDSDYKMSQRRADAAVLMAETSLQSAGREIATADRYQVVVSVDASVLATSHAGAGAGAGAGAASMNATSDKNYIPPKRPTVKGAGPIALETAKRIACDCSVSVNKASNGEPINIGRRSRIWPVAMARAIKDRDQHCQYPGCVHTKNLQIHHVKHWADGGTTSVENSFTTCAYHHTLLHEGGYTVQRVADHEQFIDEQFAQQQNSEDASQFEFEKTLRSNRSSFNTVRKLSPTRYRFRVLDANGHDIQNKENAGFVVEQDESENNSHAADYHSTRVECNTTDTNTDTDTDKQYDIYPNDYDSTRVGCAEPKSCCYHYTIQRKVTAHNVPTHRGVRRCNNTNPMPSIISQKPARYASAAC